MLNRVKTHQIFVLMKTSWRRLDQDEYIRLSHACSEGVLKTSSRCLGQDQYICLGHTSSRSLQDVFKMPTRHLAKTSSRHLQDVQKMSSRHHQNVLERYLQDVFKMNYQVKQFLLTRLRKVFNTFAKTVIYREICVGHTSVKLIQVLVFHFTTPFIGCLKRRI